MMLMMVSPPFWKHENKFNWRENKICKNRSLLGRIHDNFLLSLNNNSYLMCQMPKIDKQHIYTHNAQLYATAWGLNEWQTHKLNVHNHLIIFFHPFFSFFFSFSFYFRPFPPIKFFSLSFYIYLLSHKWLHYSDSTTEKKIRKFFPFEFRMFPVL